MDERRKHPRIEADEPAYISAGGWSTRCRIINLAAEGAAIEVADPSCVPPRFQLMTEKDRLIRDCRLIWMKQNRIGAAFE